MRISAYCTAEQYNLKELLEFLKKDFWPSRFRDVIHLKSKESQGDLFLFSYGCLICWDLTLPEEKHFLNLIKQFEIRPHAKQEYDHFQYEIGKKAKIVDDKLILPNEDVWTKIATSYGLSQSVKLTIFEDSIQSTVNETRHIPEHLAKYGKIPLSRKKMAKMKGRLFIKRSFVNLHTDMLDTPEFFWEHAELEELYDLTLNYLDIQNRVEVLNHRLNVLQELLEIITSELQHQHASTLEWIIIVLIFAEVILLLVKDIFAWI